MVEINLLLEYIKKNGLAEAVLQRCVEKGAFVDRDSDDRYGFVIRLRSYYVRAKIEDLLIPDDNEKALDTFVSKYGIDYLKWLYNYDRNQ